jgi:staphylococcal nuclease domain-containing protein 1
VRCPREPEPCAAEALAFLRTHLTQRDADVEVDGIDRAGAFTGALYVPTPKGGPTSRASLALVLLEVGLAHATSAADARPEGRQMREAEAAARAASRGLWKDYVEPEPEPEERPEDIPDMAVTVTDVRGGGQLYLQRRDDPQLARVAEGLARLGAFAPQEAGFAPAPGALVAACFTGDDQWYRAHVVSARNGAYSVFFCDWGNSETLPAARLAPLEPELAAIPALAQLAQLAHIKVPALDAEGGLDAAHLLGSLTGGGRAFTARVEARKSAHGARHGPSAAPSLSVVLQPAEEGAEGDASVNGELLRAGLARLVRGTTPRARAAVDALRPQLDEARAARRNLYEYGDPADSDDEDAARGGGGRARGR